MHLYKRVVLYRIFIISLTITLVFSVCSCEKNESPDQEVYFRAIIKGDSISFQSPVLYIKTMDRNPYQQHVSGYLVQGDTAAAALKIIFHGNFTRSDSIKRYGFIGGFYYENNYDESWACFDKTLKLTTTRVTRRKAWGSANDFIAVNDLDTITITGIEFEAIPISRINFKSPKGPFH